MADESLVERILPKTDDGKLWLVFLVGLTIVLVSIIAGITTYQTTAAKNPLPIEGKKWKLVETP